MSPDDCPSVFRLLAEMAEPCESPAIAAHLGRCRACAERVEAVVRHATHNLGGAPYDCDDAMLLVACPGEVEPDERELASLFIHLVECLPCRALSGEDDDGSNDDGPNDDGPNDDGPSGDPNDGSDTDTGDDETWAQRPDAGFDAAPPDHDSLPLVEKCTFTWGPELGRGGMGRVSEVRDRRLGRTVVIKEPLLDDELEWNQRQVLFARFEYEARVTACLSHPAIVAVHEAGRWRNGTPFYTMRRVRGVPLDEAIERAATAHERLGLLLHVIAATDAVAYAHSEGVLHRDLKPHNIVVGAFGETVVLDWGLAKDLDTALDTAAVATGDASASGPAQRDSATAAFGPMVLTTCGHIVGTPAYMAPEQALGSDVDQRADVYALGAILYHVVAGHAPYADQSGSPTGRRTSTLRQRQRAGRRPAHVPAGAAGRHPPLLAVAAAGAFRPQTQERGAGLVAVARAADRIRGVQRAADRRRRRPRRAPRP